MNTPSRRGIVYPHTLPELTRFTPAPEVADLVQWFWLPRWHLAPGVVRPQTVLAFPAANLTIEPHATTLTGPTTTLSTRDLRGRGWALGALLHPAGLAQLDRSPRPDHTEAYPLPVAADIRTLLHRGENEAAVRTLSDWFARLPLPPPRAVAANTLVRITAESADITTTARLAAAMGVSARTVQRLAADFIGLPPLAIIRRYRLQEAAELLRTRSVTIADVAADLGYTDHAHLTHDFRRIFGTSPRQYRADQEVGENGERATNDDQSRG